MISLVALVLFVGAFTRATFGFGEAVVSMPLLALMPIGLHAAASLVGLTGLTVAALSTAARTRDVDVRALLRLTVGTVAGIPLGIFLLLNVPGRLTGALLGLVLCLYAAYCLLPIGPNVEAGLRPAYVAGVAAGALGAAYNFNGVPVVVYGTMRGWQASRFRGTLQAHFLVSGALVVASQALGGVWTSQLPTLFGASLPAIGVATWCGHKVHGHIPVDHFRKYVYWLLLLLGAVLLLRDARVL